MKKPNSLQEAHDLKEEHDAALDSAREALLQSKEVARLGRERLLNAIEKYERRSKIYGPSKRF
jgi:hypothetical protein